MTKNTVQTFLPKVKEKSRAIALVIVLLLCSIGTIQAQNINVLFYDCFPNSGIGINVNALRTKFETVTVNGVVRTADFAYPDRDISNLPTSVSSYTGIQLIVAAGWGYSAAPPPRFISLAQADALIAFVKQGGILAGSFEGLKVGSNSGTDVNKYLGENLLLQPGVSIVATAENSTINASAPAYHNNGPLGLTRSALTVGTTTTASSYLGIPSESSVFTAIKKPTATIECSTTYVLDFIAPSYPGDSNAKTAGINGFAYLSGEINGPLTSTTSRVNTQANYNLVDMIYDFLNDPRAMASRRAWSRTPANVNSFCPVTTYSVEPVAYITNTCPATTVNLNSHHTATVPFGSSLVWFDNNTHTGTPISNPTAVGTSGTYYAFYYDSVNDCWSPASIPVNVTITPVTDTDGDGLADCVDIDDDNDGILDADESPACFYTAFEIKSQIASITSQFPGDDFTLLYNGITETTAAAGFNFTTAQTVTTNPAGSNLFTIQFTKPVELSSVVTSDDISSTAAARARLFGSNNGTTWTQLTSAESNINTATGTTFTINQNQGKYLYYRIQTTVAGAIATANWIGEITPVLAANYIPSQYAKPGICSADADGDGIPNHLDTDADGDTCFDAIEGAGNILPSQLHPNGSINSAVDANGVPVLASGGQGVGYSQNSTVNLCIDTDGDGIADMYDLDNDNDGILDTDEGVSCTSGISDFGWYYNGSPQNRQPVGIAVNATVASATNQIDGAGLTSVLLAAPSTSLQIDKTYLNQSNLTGAIANNDYIGMSFTTRAFPALSAATLYGTKLWIEADSNSPSANPNASQLMPYQFSMQISTDPTFATGVTTIVRDATVTHSGVRGLVSYEGNSYKLQSSTTYYLRYYLYNVQASGPRIVFDDQVPLFRNCTFTDTDGDGIPDYLDLDSDNDGCLDAIEGDENVTQAMLVNAHAGLSVGTGSTASNQNLCAGTGCVDAQGVPTVVNTGGAADIGNDQGQGIGSSRNALVNVCHCTQPGIFGQAGEESMTGISDLEGFASGWPKNIPNGYIVMESRNSGFVITRVNSSNDIVTPVEGMLVYDITAACVKLYNGTVWKCLQRSCNE